ARPGEALRRRAPGRREGSGAAGSSSDLGRGSVQQYRHGRATDGIGEPRQVRDLALSGSVPHAKRNGAPPRQHAPSADELASWVSLTAPVAGAFDALASRIDSSGVRILGFTSALSGEGVSTIALGTALALAALRRDAVDLPALLPAQQFVVPWPPVLDQLFVVLVDAATPLALVRQALEKLGSHAATQLVLNRASAPEARFRPTDRR